MTQNIVCKIFKEQFDLIKNLPQQERKEVLYLAIENAFNQIENQNDNQIENQNENAYISNSLSNLSISILNILNKTISVKEFSSNYGGNRKNAGRPVNPKKQNDPIKEKFNTPIKEKFKDNITSNNITSNKKEIYKEKFEEFWKLYTPVKCNGKFIDKGSRKTAEEKFIKILEKGEDYESIINGCKEYIEHCRENNQLTCGVTVFLNQERWKGDYSGNACKESDSGERQKSRSIVETYAEIAAELAEKDNLW